MPVVADDPMLCCMRVVGGFDDDDDDDFTNDPEFQKVSCVSDRVLSCVCAIITQEREALLAEQAELMKLMASHET
jgi:hypothetical protein